MGLLSDAMDRLKGVVNFGTNIYREVTPEPIQNVWEGVASVPAGIARTGYTGAVEPVMKADRYIYSHAISHPLSALITADNPFSESFLNPVEAWQNTSDVSPGQAATANPFTRFGMSLLNPVFAINATQAQTEAGVVGTNPLGLAGFDPTNDAQRKAVFEDNSRGKQQSGLFDLALNWYTDPLVIAGRTAQGINKAQGGFGAVDQAKEVARADALTDKGMQRWAYKPNVSPTEWRVDPVVAASSNKEVAAAALHGAETPEERMLIYKTTIGDPYAWNELLTKRASIADELGNARGVQTNADQAIHDYLNLVTVGHPAGEINDIEWLTSISKVGEDIGRNDPAYMALTDEVTKAKAVVDDLTRRDKWLSAAADPENHLFGSVKTQAVPRSAALQAMKESRARTSDRITNGYWVEKFGENSAKGRAMRVMRWVGGYTPAGWVATSGYDLAGSSDELRATLIQAGADTGTQQKWLDKWMTSVDQTERMKVAADMEDELFATMAHAHGYTVEQANDLLTKTKLARSTARDQMLADPTMIHTDGSVSLTPQMETQLREQTPLMNFGLLRQTMEADRRSMAEARASTGAMIEGKALDYWHTGDSVLSAFNLFWKPTVLLRLGYTGRNVGESLVASFVRTGAFVADPFTGALHVYQQLPQRLARRSARASTREAAGEITDQLAFHAEERAHWNNQIVEIDKQVTERETYLAQRAAQERAIAEKEALAEAEAAAGGRSVPRTPAAIHADEQRKIAKYAAQQNRTITRSTAARDNAQRSLSRARKRKAETPEEFEARRQISRDQIDEHNALIAQAEARKATLPARIARNDLRGEQIAQAEAAVRQEDVVVTHAKTVLEELRADRAGAEQHLANIEADVEQLRTWVDQLEAVTLHKPRTGSNGRMTDGIAYNGAFHEANRAAIEKLVSGDVSNRMLVRNFEAEQYTARRLTSRLEPTGVRKIDTDDPAYYASLQGIINNEFRPSKWMNDLMAGKPPSEVADWIRTSTEGRAIMTKMRWTDDMIDGQVLKMNHLMETYLPDEELRRLAVAGDVSENKVKSRLAGRDDLSQLHGREVKEITGYLGHGDARGALEGWENIVQKAFHFLGTMPEDAGARFPLYNHLYNQSMDQAIAANREYLHSLSQEKLDETVRLMESASHAHALREVRNTIYTVERRHNIAVAMRYWSPFLGVTINRFGFYGRMAVQYPRNTARLFLGYNSIPTVTDSFGDKQILVTLPGPVAKALAIAPGGQFDGLDDGPVNLAISKRSLNLIGQGSPWWNPGFGPPITVPVAALSRNSGEDPNWLEQLVIPYGSGHGVKDQFLPNTAQKWLATHRDSAQWGNDFSMAGAYETYRAHGGMRDMPTNEEIAKRADALGWIRFLSAAVSPVSTKPTDPLQPQADYMKQMRELDHVNGTNNADAEFLAKYPDYFEFMVSMTKNPYNIDPLGTSVKRQKANTELIANIVAAGGDPSIVGTVIDNPDDYGYDQTAYNWQKDNALFPGGPSATRPSQTLDEALRSRQESRGWIEYNKVDQDIKDMLKARGLTSTSQSGAQDLAALKGSIVDKIAADYPAWGDAYQQRDGSYYARNVRSFVAVANDPKMLNDPVVGRWLPSAIQYLTLRQDITGILAERAKAGGSDSFSAKSNADLQGIWQSTTTKMSASNPAWADVFTRYFENDNMLPAGVTY